MSVRHQISELRSNKIWPCICRNEGSTQRSNLGVPGGDVCPVTRQVHETYVKDQVDTHTDVLTGDDKVNAIDANAAIKNMMAPSLSARYTTHN